MKRQMLINIFQTKSTQNSEKHKRHKRLKQSFNFNVKYIQLILYLRFESNKFQPQNKSNIAIKKAINELFSSKSVSFDIKEIFNIVEMKSMSSLEESFVADTCFYHPGLLIEAVCMDEGCSSDQLLCCECIKTSHHTHDLLPFQKYKRIAVQAVNQTKKVLAWRWEEQKEKSRLKEKDKKLLTDFRGKMDAAWHKIEKALNIVEHAGDMKIVRKTLNTASQRLQQYVDGKLDQILERAREFQQNKVIELSDSEQQPEKQAPKTQNNEDSKQKKRRKKTESFRLDSDKILKEAQKQEQKASKERTEIISKKIKKEGKISKEKQGQRNKHEIKGGERKQKREKKRENDQDSGLKIVRNRKPSQEENVEYFKIIDHTKDRERQIMQKRVLPYLKIPEVYEVEEGEEETERLKRWYKEIYRDQQCRIFAHRFLKDKTKEYMIYFANEFNWIKAETLRGTDFEAELNQYERTTSRMRNSVKK